jgi:hypothetical protein
MPIRQVSEGRRIEHVRTNRDILGESDARHCHRPGTWQMGVHHDLSPSGLGAAGDRRVTQLLWPQGTSTVLGVNLKCSESRLPGNAHPRLARLLRRISAAHRLLQVRQPLLALNAAVL